MIIAISGTPATGKSSVSKILAEKLGWKLIDLNQFAEEKGLYSGWDEKRKCKIVNEKKMASEVKKLRGNFVVESHYAHDIDNDITVILRTRPDELRKRMSEKGWKKEKTEENVLAEIMEVCKTEALEKGRKVIEIDTTGKEAKKVAQEIIDSLQLDEQ